MLTVLYSKIVTTTMYRRKSMAWSWKTSHLAPKFLREPELACPDPNRHSVQPMIPIDSGSSSHTPSHEYLSYKTVSTTLLTYKQIFGRQLKPQCLNHVQGSYRTSYGASVMCDITTSDLLVARPNAITRVVFFGAEQILFTVNSVYIFSATAY